MRGNKFLKFLDTICGAALIAAISFFLRFRRRDISIQPIRRILVTKLAALGDTILLVPALREIRLMYPEARIVFLGTSINERIIALFPQYVDSFICFDISRTLKNPLYFFSFLRRLRAEHFELAVDCEQWTNITPLLVWLSRAPQRIGFNAAGKRKIRSSLFTTVVVRNSDVHEAVNFLSLVEAFGAPRLEMPVEDNKRQNVKKILAEKGYQKHQPLVLIHPGCGSHGFPREWPLEFYKELCTHLLDQRSMFFVITGEKDEQHLANALGQHCGEHAVVWTENDLSMLIALISLSTLAISGNNGIMHLVASLKIPQIALHGPTDSKKWGPLNPRATVLRSHCPGCPCLDLGFEYHRMDGFCMRQISVQEVFNAVMEQLSQR